MNTADVAVDSAIEQSLYDISNFLFSKLVNPIIQIAIGLLIIYFLYTIARFLWAKGQGKVDTAANQHMIYGLIGLTIIFTAVSIAYFVGNSGNKLFMKAGGADATRGLENVGELIIR